MVMCHPWARSALGSWSRRCPSAGQALGRECWPAVWGERAFPEQGRLGHTPCHALAIEPPLSLRSPAHKPSPGPPRCFVRAALHQLTPAGKQHPQAVTLGNQVGLVLPGHREAGGREPITQAPGPVSRCAGCSSSRLVPSSTSTFRALAWPWGPSRGVIVTGTPKRWGVGVNISTKLCTYFLPGR